MHNTIPNKTTKTQLTTAAKPAVVQTELSAAERARVTGVFQGVDLHKIDCAVTTILSGSAAQPPQTIATQKMVGAVKRQLERYPNAQFHIGYEAGPCGYWLHRELSALPRVHCHVMAPEALNGRRKTDKRDSRALALKLRARFVDNDPKAFSEVRVPTLEQEQQRSILRLRRALLRSYAQQTMRCKSAALLHGCNLKGKFWLGEAWEKTLPAKLPGQIRRNIASLRKIILAIVEEIAGCNEQIKTLSASEGPVPHGIGMLTWMSLKLEVGDWKRFKGRRAVASYTGLCPGEHSSGKTRVELSIDKIGNRNVRHALVEAAWRMERFQPNYPPVKKFLAQAKGNRARRRAIVAVARQLGIDLWRLATGRASAEQIGLRYEPMPPSPRNAKASPQAKPPREAKRE